jgi:hypothetical protein
VALQDFDAVTSAQEVLYGRIVPPGAQQAAVQPVRLGNMDTQGPDCIAALRRTFIFVSESQHLGPEIPQARVVTEGHLETPHGLLRKNPGAPSVNCAAASATSDRAARRCLNASRSERR